MERLLAEDCTQVGLYSTGSGSVQASDLAFRRMGLREGFHGWGITATHSALDFDRVLIEDIAGQGMAIYGTSDISGTDVIVRNVHQPPGLDYAEGGVIVDDQVTSRWERLSIKDVVWSGLWVDTEATAELVDVRVQGVVVGTVGHAGNGILVQNQSRVEGERVWVAGARHVGLRTTQEASIILEDVVVEGTRPMDCAETSCAGDGESVGVHAQGESRIDLLGFIVRDNDLLGVGTGGGGTVALVDGEVRGHLTGVQGTVIIGDDVVLVDNEIKSADAGTGDLSEY